MRHTILTTCLLLCAAGCASTPDQPTVARADVDALPVPPVEDATPSPAPVPLPGVPPRLRFVTNSDGLPDTGMWKCDPIFADLNDDGHLDLAAIPRLGNGPRVWFGNGAGTWREASNGLRTDRPSCGGGVVPVDLNDDGHLDLAVADHCSGIYIYLGDGAGNWTAVARGLHPDLHAPGTARALMMMGAEDLDVGDVNGDGLHDLVVGASDEGGINVYYGDGTGRTWTRDPKGVVATGWALRVQLHDMNDDGHLDVVASHSEGPRVWRGDGAGNWRAESHGMPSPMMRGMYTGLAVADINNDGRPDIACANWIDGPEVYLQTEDHTWNQTDDVFPLMIGGSVGVALGDLDRDGNVDLLVSGRLRQDPGLVRGVFALCGDGSGGAWTLQESCGLPMTGLYSTAGIAVADFNADGYLDVAAGSGLHVEGTNSAGPPTPAIPEKLIVWSTHPADAGAAANRVAEVDLASGD